MTRQVRSEAELRQLIASTEELVSASVTREERAALFDEMRHRHSVRVELGSKLVSSDFDEWFDATRRRETEWFYWKRYREHLAQSGYPVRVLETMDEKTDRIIELCGDPTANGGFDRRGMVMGDVQAGKTGNYTALVSKAADVGYRVIIIIAGIHENLRSQTQKRIDEGLIGRDSNVSFLDTTPGISRVGVGMQDASRTPASFTTRSKDFRKGLAEQLLVRLDAFGNEPVVFVIKKNASVLRNLIAWLKRGNTEGGRDTIRGRSMILIDDEADNASINVARDPGAISRINGQIRELLNLFEKSSYVAFTATPFANIFIDPDTDDDNSGKDLFPEHFLIQLDRPDNYFGAEKVFLGSDDDAELPTRPIGDNDPEIPIKMPKGFSVDALPESLKEAMRAFIVAGAIRRLRGQADRHHSMLVNVSHLTDIQRQVAELIKDELRDAIRPALDMHAMQPPDIALRNGEIAALKAAFDGQFMDSEFRWEEVQPQLRTICTRTRVHQVNSKSDDRLDYPDVKDPENDQATVIAVGGYSLSRGLTLEGLTISYFLRNSKAYDTLLQMARWFGYRPGYEDLCRIWIKDEARDWYSHIAAASEELRQDLKYMAAQDASPREFGLRVRRHPSALEITARNKAGSGKEVTVDVSLALSQIETTIIHDEGLGGEAEANRQAVVNLHRALGDRPWEDVGASRLFRNVPVAAVTDFLAEFRNHPDAMATQPEPVIRYIRDREEERLGSWDVVFVGSKLGNESVAPWTDLGFPLRLQERTPGKRDGGAIVATKRRFSSRGIAQIGMSEDAIQRARDDSKTSNVPDSAYLARRERPFLAVHVMRLRKKGTKELDEGPPVTAWTMGFPETSKKAETVSYQVNRTWWLEHADEFDEEVADALEREDA
jgi:hypothetical protein